MKTETISARELLLQWPQPLIIDEDITSSVGVEVPIPSDNGGTWYKIYTVGSPALIGTYENEKLGTLSLYYRLNPGEGVYALHGDALGGQGERRTLYRRGFYCPK